MDGIDNTITYKTEDIVALLDFTDEYRNFTNTQQNYQRLFEKYFAKNKPFLDAYDKAFVSLVPDTANEQATDAAADQASAAADQARSAAFALIDSERSKIESAKKWNRGILMAGDSVLFVTFLIPAVVSYNTPSSDALAEAIVTEWNRVFPKSNIKKSDYNTIFSGFRKPGIAGLFGFR